jgi:hypothetical protein
VDEELDGELVESQVAAREYSMLIQSSDIELTEAFTNSEMYVRVTVAVMLHKFVLLIQMARVSQDSEVLAIAKSAATCGQMLLLELLNAAVEDPNLSKELYKKKSLHSAFADSSMKSVGLANALRTVPIYHRSHGV